jgi:hypothetical protein
MSAAVPSEITGSRDLAIAAIKEAYAEIGKLERHSEAFKAKGITKRTSVEDPVPKISRRSLRILFGTFFLVCIGIAVPEWEPNFESSPIFPPVSSTSAAKKVEQHATSSSAKPEAQIEVPTKLADPKPVSAPEAIPTPPAIAPTSPGSESPPVNIQRDLATVRERLHELQNEQARVARENIELNEQVRTMREVERRNADLTEELKSTQAKTSLEIVGLKDQLKASEDRTIKVLDQLKDSQDKAARLAADQRQRSVRKPAPQLSAPVRIPRIPKPVQQ